MSEGRDDTKRGGPEIPQVRWDDAPKPVEKLGYAEPGMRNWEGAAPARVEAGWGFLIGVGIFGVILGAWWFAASGLRGWASLEGLAFGLIGVPAIAGIIGGVMQTQLRIRGAVAGVFAAMGITMLIGCAGIAILCGGLK